MVICKLRSIRTIFPYAVSGTSGRPAEEKPAVKNRMDGLNVMRDFRELKVWGKSHKLTLKVYRLSKQLPKTERYGLANQMRRASASIPINIAEGCGRRSNKDLAYFLQIAMGSACELEYLLLLVSNLNMLPLEDCRDLNAKVIEVKRMLTSFIRYLRGT